MIICGTGHRPDKLGGYDRQAILRLQILASRWLSLHPEVEVVISGMALGWDTALAYSGLRAGCRLIAAVPFEGQESRWPKESQELYKELLLQATQVVYVSEPSYAVWKMQKRNEWMVDASDRVLALWNGSKGGTHNCVKYAEKKGKPIVNLWDRYNGTGM